MPHRALQIVQQLKTLHQASANFALVSIFRDREEMLDQAAEHLPAINITLGPDVPREEEGQSNMAFYDSELEVVVTLFAGAADSDTLVDELMELRRTSAIILWNGGDPSLGLAFVSLPVYGGAAAPDLSDRGKRLVGRLDTRWTIKYRMNQSDPA